MVPIGSKYYKMMGPFKTGWSQAWARSSPLARASYRDVVRAFPLQPGFVPATEGQTDNSWSITEPAGMREIAQLFWHV